MQEQNNIADIGALYEPDPILFSFDTIGWKVTFAFQLPITAEWLAASMTVLFVEDCQSPMKLFKIGHNDWIQTHHLLITRKFWNML